MKFNSGDIILFSIGEGLKTNIGMILKHKDNGNYVVLSQYSTAYKDIQPEWIDSIDNAENIRNEVKSYYDKLIAEKQILIKKVTQEEKDADKEYQYRELQKEIKVVAKRLSESTDDVDFENRLKAISDMKKNIFSIELECVSQIRKANGKIKYEIRELEMFKENTLSKISNENINKAFNFN